MKIAYLNQDDSFTKYLGKRVIMHSEIDSHAYAGIILNNHRYFNGAYDDCLVFLSNNPHCIEFEDRNNNHGLRVPKHEPNFAVDVSDFKTSMFIGEGEKQFGFAVEYSEDDNFITCWNELLAENKSEYVERVKDRRRGITCF